MLEQFDLARQCLKSLVAVPRLDYQTAYKLALIYERVGQPREALDYLQRSLNEGKRASQVLNEPIFRSNQAVQDLLARYPTSRTPCD